MAPYSDQKNWSNTYLTDPELLKLLGPFDTDPCVHTEMPWKTATNMFNIEDDGLSRTWEGRVFMNPPYRGVMKWAKKFIDSRDGVALLNGRSTETRATQVIMDRSEAIWFPEGRLSFFKPDGSAWPQKWFPSLLIGLSSLDLNSFKKAQEVYGGVIYVH